MNATFRLPDQDARHLLPSSALHSLPSHTEPLIDERWDSRILPHLSTLTLRCLKHHQDLLFLYNSFFAFFTIVTLEISWVNTYQSHHLVSDLDRGLFLMLQHRKLFPSLRTIRLWPGRNTVRFHVSHCH